MYKSLFEKKIISELAKEINKKTDTKVESPEEVFDKLDLIYEEAEEREFGQLTGRKVKYMPKRWKEVLMRLVAPNFAVSTRVEYHEEYVVAESYLYLDRTDAKPICSGKSYCYFASMDTSLSVEEKRNSAEMMARGLAESKAYQKYGIGAWFSNEFSLEDNPEPVRAQSTTLEPHVLEPQETTLPEQPRFPFVEESENATEMATAETETATVTQTVTQAVVENTSELPFIEPETPKATPTTAPVINSNSNNLEELLKIKADIGKAASMGLSLGEVMEKFPINLVWMYTHGCSEDVKNAIEKIALAYPNIKALFDERSVPL